MHRVCLDVLRKLMIRVPKQVHDSAREEVALVASYDRKPWDRVCVYCASLRIQKTAYLLAGWALENTRFQAAGREWRNDVIKWMTRDARKSCLCEEGRCIYVTSAQTYIWIFEAILQLVKSHYDIVQQQQQQQQNKIASLWDLDKLYHELVCALLNHQNQHHQQHSQHSQHSDSTKSAIKVGAQFNPAVMAKSVVVVLDGPVSILQKLQYKAAKTHNVFVDITEEYEKHDFSKLQCRHVVWSKHSIRIRSPVATDPKIHNNKSAQHLFLWQDQANDQMLCVLSGPSDWMFHVEVNHLPLRMAAFIKDILALRSKKFLNDWTPIKTVIERGLQLFSDKYQPKYIQSIFYKIRHSTKSYVSIVLPQTDQLSGLVYRYRKGQHWEWKYYA